MSTSTQDAPKLNQAITSQAKPYPRHADPRPNQAKTRPTKENTMNQAKSTLKLLHANCQRYTTAKTDIDLLIHEQKPDIINLQETLRDKKNPAHYAGYPQNTRPIPRLDAPSRLNSLRIKAHKIACGIPKNTNGKFVQDSLTDILPKERIYKLAKDYLSKDNRAPSIQRLVTNVREKMPLSMRNPLYHTPIGKIMRHTDL
jgi:hypothetical protein